ncbi:MAG: hypothetical protein ACRDVP_11770 [Acidimicrobiales bacterium]
MLWSGQSLDLYRKLSATLGVDVSTAAGMPQGQVHHISGHSGEKLIVVEVWDSKADQEEFSRSQLAPALEQANVPAPARMEWFAQAGDGHRH